MQSNPSYLSFDEQTNDSFSSDSIYERVLSARHMLKVLKEAYEANRPKGKTEDDIFVDGLIDKTIEQINMGIEEGALFLTIYDYLMYLDMEKLKVQMKYNNLSKENEWLKEEASFFSKWNLTVDGELKTCMALKDFCMDRYTKLTNKTVEKEKAATNIMASDFNMGLTSAQEIPVHMRGVYNLILEYTNQGRYELAIGLGNHALYDMKKRQKDNTREYAVMLNILALLYRDQGNFRLAISALEETLKLYNKMGGDDNPHLVATLNNLAVLLGKKGRFKEAEQLCRRALEVKRKQFPNDHPDVAKQMNNLALILQNIRLVPEIEELYQQAVTIYSKNVDRHRLHLVKAQNNLSAYYIKMGNYDMAEKTLRSILEDLMQERNPINNLNLDTSSMRRPKNILGLLDMCNHYKTLEELPADLLQYFKSTGMFIDPSYKNTYKYLSNLYNRTARHLHMAVVDKYLAWCVYANHSETDIVALMQRTSVNQTEYRVVITKDSTHAPPVSMPVPVSTRAPVPMPSSQLDDNGERPPTVNSKESIKTRMKKIFERKNTSMN